MTTTAENSVATHRVYFHSRFQKNTLFLPTTHQSESSHVAITALQGRPTNTAFFCVQEKERGYISTQVFSATVPKQQICNTLTLQIVIQTLETWLLVVEGGAVGEIKMYRQGTSRYMINKSCQLLSAIKYLFLPSVLPTSHPSWR